MRLDSSLTPPPSLRLTDAFAIVARPATHAQFSIVSENDPILLKRSSLAGSDCYAFS
jgi:hypothetical protein